MPQKPKVPWGAGGVQNTKILLIIPTFRPIKRGPEVLSVFLQILAGVLVGTFGTF